MMNGILKLPISLQARKLRSLVISVHGEMLAANSLSRYSATRTKAYVSNSSLNL